MYFPQDGQEFGGLRAGGPMVVFPDEQSLSECAALHVLAEQKMSHARRVVHVFFVVLGPEYVVPCFCN
jgi:hypothetical protein